MTVKRRAVAKSEARPEVCGTDRASGFNSHPTLLTVDFPNYTRRCAVLVLTRKASEKLMLNNITITIVRVKGNRVLVGIEAPKEVKIVRGEVRRDGGKAA